MNGVPPSEERPQTGRRRGMPRGRRPDPARLAEIEALLGDRTREPALLIEFLHLIQDKYGHLSAGHLAALAHLMQMAQAEVYEVASFYHHFDIIKENEAAPPEITVRVCESIVCDIKGSHTLIEQMKAKFGDRVRVLHAPCMGACDHAPVASMKKKQFPHATVEAVAAAVEKKSFGPDIPSYQDFAAYRKAGGYENFIKLGDGRLSRDTVWGEIDKAGLRGMGGAGFPTARKWKFLEGTAAPRAMVVNGDEGEPGTFKDRYILETSPHKVIEGMLTAARWIGAENAYLYLRDEYPQIHTILHKEIAALEASGIVKDIKIHLRRGAGAYICGEETSLLESLEGKRGLPRNRPPFPANYGAFGRPTLINNIETLYWVSEILTNGSQWYLDEGKPKFYSVSGRVKKPGVVRAPAGITAKQIIEDYCGGMEDGETFKAYLPGGASGGVLPASLGEIPLDFGKLEPYGSFAGSAAVVIFSNRDTLRGIASNILKFFEDESCGQCTPCRVGCTKMLGLIEHKTWDAALIQELAQAMRDASICGLGQAAPNPVLSALKYFEGETQ
jgi:NADH:ubiquinone oxidoreductase subunit F (NADH-binding)/NADH:ubiquinone oxidoreductase subunit E